MDVDGLSSRIVGLQIDDSAPYPRLVSENVCDLTQVTNYIGLRTTRTLPFCEKLEYESIFRGTLVNIKEEYDQCSELEEFHSDRGGSKPSNQKDHMLLESEGNALDYTRDLQLHPSSSNTACCFSRDTKPDVQFISNSPQSLESVVNLCQRCFQMLHSIDLAEMEGRRHAGETYELHQTPDSLNPSSLAGCRICSKIQQQVDIDTLTGTVAKTIQEPREQYYGPGSRAFVRVMIWKYDSCLGLSCFIYYQNFGFKALPEPSRVSFSLTPVLSNSYPNLNLDNGTDSTTSLELIKKWMESCSKTHTRCYPADILRINDAGLAEGRHQEPWYPTRLLDLRTRRLVHTKDLDISGGYATLSHCWGSVKPVQLFHDNFESFCHSLPSLDLPKTFRDAIDITKRLEIPYLWIDALCIIQDCDYDWQYEASVMGKVYQNSFLNLSASDSIDGHGGCYRSRSAPAAEVLPDCIHWSGNFKPYTLMDGSHVWEIDIATTPLGRRAWVLQERLLAPRTVHFGRSELKWECREAIASETYATGLPVVQLEYLELKQALAADIVVPPSVGVEPPFEVEAPLEVTALSEMKSPSEVQLSVEVEPPVRDELPMFTFELSEQEKTLLSGWRSMIWTYTNCGLTKPGDKLVALSGIASATQAHLGEYNFGIWRRFMPHDLLWYVRPNEKYPTIRPQVYRAPTWSWASVEGGIISYNGGTIHIPTVNVYQLDPKGMLFIYGQPITLRWVWCETHETHWLESLKKKDGNEPSFVLPHTGSRLLIEIHFDCLDPRRDASPSFEYTFLPLSHECRPKDTEGCSYVGLLLEAPPCNCGESHPPFYSRVGRAVLGGITTSESALTDFIASAAYGAVTIM